uniref:Uncharacterized protein n=1 Tax=Glossina austeni TaxID=7395 RepID=A0A1A9VXV9_GLOAU
MGETSAILLLWKYICVLSTSPLPYLNLFTVLIFPSGAFFASASSAIIKDRIPGRSTTSISSNLLFADDDDDGIVSSTQHKLHVSLACTYSTYLQKNEIVVSLRGLRYTERGVQSLEATAVMFGIDKASHQLIMGGCLEIWKLEIQDLTD